MASTSSICCHKTLVFKAFIVTQTYFNASWLWEKQSCGRSLQVGTWELLFDCLGSCFSD